MYCISSISAEGMCIQVLGSVMISIKGLIRDVEHNSLPECISHFIHTFNDLSRKSNEASLEIRSNYLDIWREYVKRPRIGR